MKVSNLMLYGLIGAGAGYLFYKFTETPLASPKKQKQTIVLVKLPIPKGVGKSVLHEIVNKLKPKRIMPSFRPLGVNLEWDPVMVDTVVGKVGYTPPKKFVKLKTVTEVKRAIDQAQVSIKDKGIYWEVSFTIMV